MIIHTLTLPVPNGWSAETLPETSMADITEGHSLWMKGRPISNPFANLGLICTPLDRANVVDLYDEDNEVSHSIQERNTSTKRRTLKRTWRTEGPGAPRGIGHSISEDGLFPAFSTAF